MDLEALSRYQIDRLKKTELEVSELPVSSDFSGLLQGDLGDLPNTIISALGGLQQQGEKTFLKGGLWGDHESFKMFLETICNLFLGYTHFKVHSASTVVTT